MNLTEWIKANSRIIRDILCVVGLIILGLYNYNELTSGMASNYYKLYDDCNKKVIELGKIKTENEILMSELCYYESNFGVISQENFTFYSIMRGSLLTLSNNPTPLRCRK